VAALRLPDSEHSTALLVGVLLPFVARAAPVFLLQPLCGRCCPLWCAMLFCVASAGRRGSDSDSDSDEESEESEESDAEDAGAAEEEKRLAGARRRRRRRGGVGFLMSDICSEHSSWANAVAESGLLRCGALEQERRFCRIRPQNSCLRRCDELTRKTAPAPGDQQLVGTPAQL
jgi:hypothetical protein